MTIHYHFDIKSELPILETAHTYISEQMTLK
jgi:hypothetical protein